ncbi:MAG: hypothetical protein CMI09_00490 [Oceanospirillaceae bacterium]|nr:hypothetical protein [Oceanospirillaceae bacterium]
MDIMTEQSYSAGVIAGQSALTGRRGEDLIAEMRGYYDLWLSDLTTSPSDEMTAAWLIGFSGALARHYSLVAITSSQPPVLN